MVGDGHFGPAFADLLLHLPAGSSLDHDDALAARRLGLIMGKGLLQRCLEDGLVLLGQLPAHGAPPVPQRLRQGRERAHQPVRRLVEHDGAGLRLQLLQDLLLLLLLPGEKGLKAEAPRRQSGDDQARHAGAGPGHRGNGNPRLQRHPHQVLAGIGDAGHTGVRDQGDVLAGQELVHQDSGLFDPVVRMVAGHRRMDVKVTEQPDAVARILRGDQVGLLQDADRPEGHVLQVADGRRAQI